jgi:hypothetical protein
MSSTEVDRARDLARALFDEVVSPLAEARRAAGKPAFFATARDPKATTYYTEPLAGVMRPADFEFPGGGSVEGLVDALAARWAAQGEAELAAMAPRLKEIARALKDEADASDGSVSIFCYTMF